jgi:hypothetical protein
VEKEAGASRAVGSGTNDQSNLVWVGEIAGMDLKVALGQKDLTAKMGMIPAQSL